MYEQLKQIGSLKRKMRGLSSRGAIHHLVIDRTLGEEGAATAAVMAADVVVRDGLSALDLLRHPQRLVATLRS